MRDVAKPLLILLSVPVIAAAVSFAGRNDWDARWRATLVRQLAAQRMAPDARVLNRYSLPTLCNDSPAASRFPPCRTQRWYDGVVRAAGATAGAGILFTAIVAGVGWFAGGRRAQFARWFRPALLFAAWGIGLLGLANATLVVLAVVSTWLYLSGTSIESTSLSAFLMIAMPAAAWGIGVFAFAQGVARRPSLTILGRRLARDKQPVLFEEVRAAAESVGARPPDQVVACLAPLLFVTEVGVSCLDGQVAGRTLCISLPLSRILTLAEFRALLAHECAHFRFEDGPAARTVTPFFAGAANALDHLRRQGRGIRRLVVWPTAELLSFFLSGVRAAATPRSEAELEADSAAASAIGALALAGAVVKAQAYSPAWYTVAAAMFDAVAANTQYVNASHLFQEAVVWNTGAERFLGLGGQRLQHPTDPHPTLSERLTALAVDPAAAASAALVTAPAHPAVELIAGYEEIERSLSASEQQLIVATGGDALRRTGRP